MNMVNFVVFEFSGGYKDVLLGGEVFFLTLAAGVAETLGNYHQNE
jgi:hypothetical protein